MTRGEPLTIEAITGHDLAETEADVVAASAAGERREVLSKFISPVFVVGDHICDSARAFALVTRRRGRGWLYRRVWHDGRPSGWLKTSDRHMSAIRAAY